MKGCIRFASISVLCMLLGACSLLGGKQSPSKENSAKPEEGKVTIRWRNETEHDNYGFNIYRSEKKDGPFVKLNKEIIPGAGTTSTPKEYVYVDQPLEIGKIFYYYIESISFAGTKERITPVTKVVVKNLISNKRKSRK